MLAEIVGRHRWIAVAVGFVGVLVMMRPGGGGVQPEPFVALGGAIPPLIVVALLLFAGLGFAGVLTGLQTWTVEMLQRRLFVRQVADLAARLPRVRHATFDDRYGPDVVNRFFDIMTMQKVGSLLLLDGLAILLSVLVGLAILAFYHPVLLAFDVILLAVIGLVVLAPMRRGTRTAVQESKSKYAVVAWFEEVARNPSLFKSGGADRWVHAQADDLARAYLDKRAAHYRVVFGQVVGALALQVLASAALLGIGGFLVIDGALTLGQLVAAELIVTMVVSSVAKMGKHLESYYDLLAAADKVGELLDLPVEEDGGERPPRRSGGASLELRRLAWDLSLYTSAEFAYVRLAQRYVTGSSIMPNKANPDTVELLRAQHAVVQGALAELQAALSLPSGYHRDLQVTKPPLIRAFESTLRGLGLVPDLIRSLEFDREAMRRAIDPELHATDLAIEAARAGVPFRQAYREAMEQGMGDRRPEDSVAARVSPGACADPRLDRLRQRLDAL